MIDSKVIGFFSFKIIHDIHEVACERLDFNLAFPIDKRYFITAR